MSDIDDPWQSWTVVRNTGTNTDKSTLRSGKDVKPVPGLFFQALGTRPQRIADMCSPDDGGVVTHSLQYITRGREHWQCSEDSYPQSDFAELWPDAVVFPEDWRWKRIDYEVGLDLEYDVAVNRL